MSHGRNERHRPRRGLFEGDALPLLRQPRRAPYKAYVDREANRLYEQMIKIVAEIDDPQERLLTAMTKCLQDGSSSPALSAWFTPATHPSAPPSPTAPKPSTRWLPGS